MKITRCSLCDGFDFQHRYAKIVWEDGVEGQLCATCFNEWLGVDRSNEKAKFERMTMR